MKIGIDIRAANWYRGTGIGTYTYQLIDAINNSKINHLKTLEDFNYIKDEKLNPMYLPMFCFKDDYEKVEDFKLEKVVARGMINTWCETVIH